MLEKILRLLKRPDLGDVEKNRKVKLLHPILLVLIVATIAFQFVLSWLAPNNWVVKWILVAVLLAEILSFWLLRRGLLDIASAGLLSLLWGILMITIFMGRGITGVSTLGQLLIVFMAGPLVGEGFAVLVTILTIAGNYLSMLVQQAGPLPFANLTFALPSLWAFQSIYFLIALGLMQAYMRNLRSSFNEVGRDTEMLKGRVSELRQVQAQLEMSDQNLRRREAILESIGIAAEKLFRGRSFGESVQQVMKDLGQATGVDRVHIFENHRDPRSGDLLSSERYEWVAEGVSPRIRDLRFQSMSYKDSGLGRWADKLARNQVLKIRSKDIPEEERARLEKQGLLSLLIVPIFVGEDWWGFIGFDETKWEREWAPTEVDALHGAAGILGGAIERRRVERALNQSEARYLAILQEQFDLICRYTPEGRATFANDAYCRYFGVSQAELHNLSVWANILPADVEGLRAKIESLTPKQPASVSLSRSRRADGEMRWMEWTDRGIFDEGGQLIEVQAVGRDIDDEVRLRSQLEDNLRTTETQAMTDALTGLLNRRSIMEHAEAEWQRARREGRSLSVVIMDVDRLKQINDSLGHLAGDAALKTLAEIMRAGMRRYDWAGRWGGDEFLLVLPGAERDEAKTVAERLRLRFKQGKVQLADQNEIELKVSLGVASQGQTDGQQDSVENLIARADQALYQAKEGGRDQVGVG